MLRYYYSYLNVVVVVTVVVVAVVVVAWMSFLLVLPTGWAQMYVCTTHLFKSTLTLYTYSILVFFHHQELRAILIIFTFLKHNGKRFVIDIIFQHIFGYKSLYGHTNKSRIKVKVEYFCFTCMYNKICPLYLTHPSMPLGRFVRSSGKLRRAPGDPSPDLQPR